MSRISSRADLVLTIAVFLLCMVGVFAMARGGINCAEKGGTYVRTALWFECIASVKP